MKKLLVIALFLGVPLACYALGINGTGTTEKGKFAVGLEGEHVFERKMEGSTINTSSLGISVMRAYPDVENINRALLNLSYGLTDYVTLYIKLGAAEFESKTDVFIQNIGRIGHMELDSDKAFAYGGGMRIELPLSQDDNALRLGVDGQYLRHENDVRGGQNFVGLFAGLPPVSVKGEFEIQEWQIAGYFAKSFGGFTPYIGVKASNLYADGHTTFGGWAAPGRVPADYDSKYNFGAFIGADLKVGDSWALGVEGRFVDETAISGKVVYNF
jgi:opacity protein-like surface antigen